ncbi:MAG TPA: hypothetical protein PK771_12765 [Spirochaetota bacterium]|nr:hypothetical protein [Spirochaetota bacterium]
MLSKRISFKRAIWGFVSIMIILIGISGCNQPVNDETKNVKVGVKASISDTRSLSANLNYLVASGDKITTISSYKVIFKKVEIGNSENDKFTLWEDENGNEKDIVKSLTFDGTKELKTGTYKYVRLTIGEVLKVSGSIKDNTTDYYGNGTATLSEKVFLWGTDISNMTGEKILTNEIKISEDCDLTFDFNVAETVTYLGGTADNTILSVKKPVINVTVVNK